MPQLLWYIDLSGLLFKGRDGLRGWLFTKNHSGFDRGLEGRALNLVRSGNRPVGKEPFNLCHRPSPVDERMRAVPSAQDARLDPAKQHRSNCPDLRWLSTGMAEEDLRGAHGVWLGVQ